MSWGKKIWFIGWWLIIGAFFTLLNRLKVTGWEHVPPGGGVVLASNHVSLFDTLLIPWVNIAKVKLEVVWAPAKAELFRIPIVSQLIRSWGAFPVRRRAQDFRAMRQIVELMRREKVMLFPEGTRSRDGRLGKGNRMAGKLIYEARPVVIPTAVIGTERLLPKGKILPRLFTRLEVRFGPPVPLEEYYAMEDTKETAEAITNAVMEAIAQQLHASGTRSGSQTPEIS
ncbi:MAG: 1-acyl-sn-glycerol-3-phosphate acyltransferase [Nitrospinota bacterium]|nr:MAG: 1-acyl-sn-glycerol-3-phosphate acyltransferase [Nitrospinota bacterium]